MTELWAHQKAAVAFAHERGGKGAMLAIPMGGGKSAATVQIAVDGDAQAIVVLCPVSVRGVWRREFAKHAPGRFAVTVLDDGTVRAKADEAKAARALAAARKQPWVLVVNYESAWRPELRRLLLGIAWDLMILDESHRVKSPSGKASRFVADLRMRSRRALALTGTPAPHSPLDVFAQARAIDPSIFGRSYTAFRNRYAICNPMFPSKVEKWINADEMRERFNRFAFTCDLTGALDIPPSTDQVVPVTLGAKARKVYDRLESDLWAEVDSGEITVANALVKLLRLQQVTSGYVQTDDGAIVEIDDAKERALADLIEDIEPDRPVVVFTRFVHDLDVVARVAQRVGRRHGEISGRRKDLTPQATMPPEIMLMGVQLQSGGVGIDLTEASVGIYFSLGFNLGDYLQSRARLHRPGQKRHVTFVSMIAEETVDETVCRALEQRQQVVEAVLHGRQVSSDGQGKARPAQRPATRAQQGEIV